VFRFPELLDRVEGNDVGFLGVPSKEAWSFLAERFDLSHKLTEASIKTLGKQWENRCKSRTNSREKVCLSYLEHKKNCMARFRDIVVNRRDNDPNDEPPSTPDLTEEGSVVHIAVDISEKIKALNLQNSKTVYGPVSFRRRPNQGTDETQN